MLVCRVSLFKEKYAFGALSCLLHLLHYRYHHFFLEIKERRATMSASETPVDFTDTVAWTGETEISASDVVEKQQLVK